MHNASKNKRIFKKAGAPLKTSYNGETIWMYFLIEDDGLSKKLNDLWNKISNSIKKGF